MWFTPFDLNNKKINCKLGNRPTLITAGRRKRDLGIKADSLLTFSSQRTKVVKQATFWLVI